MKKNKDIGYWGNQKYRSIGKEGKYWNIGNLSPPPLFLVS